MMTLTEFIEKWTDKPIDFDGIYKNQCFDLVHFYVYEVLGLTDKKLLAHPSACQVFNNFTETQYFDKIENTPTSIPHKGDIIVFRCVSSMPHGHVCIFIEGDTKMFKSFDANWPTGSLPHVQDHSYGYCSGWLHPKDVKPDFQAQLSQSNADRDRNWNWFVAVSEELGVAANVDAVVNEVKKLVSNDDMLVIRDKQIAEANTQITDLQSQITKLKFDHDDLTNQIATLTRTTIDQDSQIKSLQEALQGIKDTITMPDWGAFKLMWTAIKKLFHIGRR